MVLEELAETALRAGFAGRVQEKETAQSYFMR